MKINCCLAARPKSLKSSQTSIDQSPSQTDLRNVLSSSIPNSSPTSCRFRKAVEAYEKSLSEKEVISLDALKHLSPNELISRTRALQRDYETSIPRLYLDISSVFDKILGFSSVIDVFAQSHPLFCIVWGSVKLILETSARSRNLLRKAVRSLQTVTDQLPPLDALQRLFPKAKLLEDCVTEIFIELIGLCDICVRLFCRKWRKNLTITAFNNEQQQLDARANRVRDLFTQSNSCGLVAHYESVDSRLSEMRSSPPVLETPVCRLIPPVDDRYIALPTVMDSIEECFSEAIKGTQQGRFAIYGMGGAGKSSLAAYYAKNRVDPKRHVFWIGGKTEDTLNTSFGEIALALKLETLDTAAISSGRRRDAVKNHLSHFTGIELIKVFSIFADSRAMIAQDWLLVFDDVEDFKLLADYWPKCDHGSIIVTSRNPMSKLFCRDRGVELHQMAEDDAIQLLRSYLPSNLRGEDQDLLRSFSCHTLGALPLAIKLAAFYILEHQCSLKTYIDLMHQGRDVVERMHRFKPSGDSAFYEHTIATCWDISKEKMKHEKKSHALVLLDLMMFMDNQGLPKETFSLLGNIPDTLPDLKSLTQPLNLLEAVGILLNSSLLQMDRDHNTFIIHPMIHTAIYERMSQSERESAHKNATYILWKVFPGPLQGNDDMAARWKVSNVYFPHLLCNWTRGQGSGLPCSYTGAMTLRNGAQYAFEVGDFRKAMTLFVAAREACELPSGPENPHEVSLLLANILHFEAWMHTKLVRHAPARTSQQALEMTNRALNIRLSLLEPTNQIVATSYGNLAMFAVANGEYEDSLQYSKACLEIRMQDETAQTTNISCTHLYYGWCYLKMGRLQDAEASLHKATDVLIQHFGEAAARQKPHYIWILTAQASLYLKMNQQDTAYAVAIQAYETSTAIYGCSSPRVFVPWYKAAWWHWKKGHLDEAREMAENLYEAMEVANHYEGHRARTLNLLANICGEAGMGERARGLKERAVELAREVEGLEGEGDWEIKGEGKWENEGEGKWEDEAGFDELVFFHDR